MSTPPSSPGTNPSPGSYTLSVGAGSGSTPSLGTNPNPGSGASSAGASSGTTTARMTKRTKDEIRKHASLFDEDIVKTKYADRGSKETLSWVSAVTTWSLESKFSMVKNDALEAEQLESVYDLAMRVTQLKKFVHKMGLGAVFLVYTLDSDGKQIPDTGKCLFDDYSTPTLDDVKKSTRSLHEWDADHVLWADTLALTLVTNSCDPELQERIEERLMNVAEEDIGGATSFKIAMECITSMSHTVSMSLSIHVSNMTLKQFPGEDVTKAISVLRGAIQRLKMSHMLPPHMPLILFRIFQSSSCVGFTNFFAALYAREEADAMISGQSKRLESEQLFRIAEHQYRTMLEDGTWSVVPTKGSAFNVDGDISEPPPWKKPPASGESNERMFKNRIEYWCTQCGWNRTHLGANHQTKSELKVAREAANQAKLTAAAKPPTASPPAAGANATAPLPDAPPSKPASSGASQNASFLRHGFRL